MSKYLFHPYTRFSAIKEGSFPNITHGDGVYLYNDQGKPFMDIISSWWACSLGHNHPRIVSSIQNQASKLQHSIIGSMTHPNVINLSEKLAHLMPSSNRNCLYASDGASSVEAALKLALQYWANIGRPKKQKLIGMDQAYHGDSLGALSVGFIDDFHSPYKNVISTGTKLPFPKSTKEDPTGFKLSEKIIQNQADEIAAIIVEPLCLGSAGMKMYKPEYLHKLYEICKKYEIILIVDEIAMGFGRTGKMFAFEHANIDPDIVCVGKALTAGYMPLSACIVKSKIYETFTDLGDKDCTFYHGNTYAGHPIGCAAALSALEIYESEDIILNANKTAAFMKDEINKIAKRIPCIKDIRFLGMIGVVELKNEYQNKISLIRKNLVESGFLFRPLGTNFYFMPPLIITQNEVKKAINALAEAIELI